ncbi:MAG: response regulator transcription factor [Oscillospiraceae bacterium]|nr:response regulator transcription factor [Oscillospiraceae bacterium]
MRILLVEDERQLSDVLAALLKQQGGYSVDAVYDGVSGEDCALSGIYDAIILDVMLPKKDGMSVLRTLRTEGCSTPVLLLTAKSEVDDKITGLDCGADDYLTKPFVTGELLARLRALTRRKGELTGDELTIGQTILNRRTHELIYAENAVKLGLKEYQLMEILLENQKQILSKDRLIEKIWGYDSEAEYNAIEVYISFLRKKLTAIGSPVQIKASRGIGYYLEDGA